MTAFPTYPRYKDSGVEWLGEVPEHWEVDALRACAELSTERNRPDLPVLSVYREYGVIPKDSRDDNHNATSLDTSNYKVVRPGDLAVNKMKAWQGSLGVSEHLGIVSPAYITCRVNQDKVNGRYLHYLLRSKPLIGALDSLSYGVRVGQWDMRFEDFKRIALTYPPKPEQDRIVAFLDRKTAEIDALIAKKQRQIELLDEQKAILINRAVTRGLNPNAKLKPSGIEWIGEIPEEWEVKKFRYCAKIRGGQVDPRREPYRSTVLIAPDHVESGSGRILALCSAKDQGAESGKYEVQAGDLIYSKIRPNLRKACIAPVDCLCSADMYAITTIDDLLPSFLLGFMLGEGFTKAAVDAAMRVAMPKVNREALADFPVILPPKEEQEQIVSWFADLESSRVKALRSVQAQIQSLQTLRSTLIAHAVTGRIKV